MASSAWVVALFSCWPAWPRLARCCSTCCASPCALGPRGQAHTLPSRNASEPGPVRAPCDTLRAMDEQRFRLLADQTFRRILDGFDTLDADDADIDTAGNTLNIAYRNGTRCVVNTQAVTRQIWLAGGQSGWHFSYDESSHSWLHDKGTGDELFATLTHITQQAIGQKPRFPEP